MTKSKVVRSPVHWRLLGDRETSKRNKSQSHIPSDGKLERHDEAEVSQTSWCCILHVILSLAQVVAFSEMLMFDTIIRRYPGRAQEPEIKSAK